MSNVPPGGGFPPPPSGPPPGGGFPPPPSGGGFPPPPGGGGYPPPPGGFGGFQGGGPQGQLAEWQDRLVSGLIDWLGPMILANVLANIVGAVLLSTDSNLIFNPTGIVFSLLAVAWTLYQGYLAGETGQSMGMKQSGLRLVSEQTGQPIGGGQGVVRNILFLVNAFCCLVWPVVILDSLFPLWDDKKQTLRDKIAKSVVVKG